ncbi:hypothetical protein EYF80_040337 [Liparis tanakae]|uniref:Uncharacterized protein n=1 Tax=Liparis tanakae TaxID=230148 RepID=A0A4Z2G879_9TELE|nr:hypothetical protein EYF80_040337 [Liparis tanakae]
MYLSPNRHAPVFRKNGQLATSRSVPKFSQFFTGASGFIHDSSSLSALSLNSSWASLSFSNHSSCSRSLKKQSSSALLLTKDKITFQTIIRPEDWRRGTIYCWREQRLLSGIGLRKKAGLLQQR